MRHLLKMQTSFFSVQKVSVVAVCALCCLSLPQGSWAQQRSTEPQNRNTPQAATQANSLAKPSGTSQAAPTQEVQKDTALTQSQGGQKVWQLNLQPLFKRPTIKRFVTPSDLVARDPQIVEILDYKPSGTKLRLEQMKKLTAELKKAPLRSEAALSKSLAILRLYEEQGLVFEWMRVAGNVDPKYPDLNQTLKNIRRQEAQRYQELILNYPKNQNLKLWKFKLVIARLKLGDPSVREEAVNLLKALQGADRHRLAVVGLTIDYMAKRFPSPFGTLEELIQTSTDPYEGSALKLLLSEQQIQKGKFLAAIALLQDVIATCKNIRKTDQEHAPGLVLQAASAMLIDVSFRNGNTINQEIYQTFINNDLVDYGRAYLEEFALKVYTKNLSAALKAYGDALSAGPADDAFKTKVESRMLDLTIASNDPKLIFIAWERAFSRGIQKSISLESQVTHSVNFVLNSFKKNPDKQFALRIVNMHDSFAKAFPSYAEGEDYELRMIEILSQTAQFAEVVRRSEVAGARFKDNNNKVAALLLNLRARTQLLGLGNEIKISLGQKISSDQSLLNGYVANADKVRALLPRPESDKFYFYAALVNLLAGNRQVASTRFEDAFNRSPRSSFASDSAAVVLEFLTQKKEWVEAEKFARQFAKNAIVPKNEAYRNINKFLESIVFEHAKQLLETRQFDKAAIRFENFQKEFPNSANASVAIERAAFAYNSVQKSDLALSLYDQYLKLYPQFPQAKDIRWTAAELARNTKMFLKAAEHYQLFAKLFPEDTTARKTYQKTAECFRDANKIPEAISEYERHLKVTTVLSEQKKTLEAIANLAKKTDNVTMVLSAYERLSRITKNADEMVAVQFNLFLFNDKLGRAELAKKAALTASSLRPTSPEGFRLQSKVKFVVARYEVSNLRSRQIMAQKDLRAALEKLSKDYETTKAGLLSPCEIPGVDWCALGYFEVSKLAGDLSKLLGLVEPQKDLDENAVAELKSMIVFNRDKLKSEMRSFALQAEEALSSLSQADQESIEKIKIYVQQVKQSRDDDNNQSADAPEGSPETDF